MRTYDVIVERDSDTGLLVGHVPGWPGAHTQGVDMRELAENMQEVIAMLLDDGEPKLESELVGLHRVRVA
jgi:predicted RNase H-like HicB family nuclease